MDMYKNRRELDAIVSEINKEMEKANEFEETHYRVLISDIAEMIEYCNQSDDVPVLYKGFQESIYKKVGTFFQEREEKLRPDSETFSLGALWGILRLSEYIMYEDNRIWDRFRNNARWESERQSLQDILVEDIGRNNDC